MVIAAMLRYGGGVVPESTKTTQRFRDLIEELGQEMGYPKGWKTEVAQRLGISASFLSKVLAGKRDVSLQTAHEAADRLGLDRSWFTSDTPGYRRKLITADRFVSVTDADAKRFLSLVGRAKRIRGDLAPPLMREEDARWLEQLPEEVLDLAFVRMAQRAAELSPERRRAVALQLARLLSEIPLVEMTPGALIAAGLAMRQETEGAPYLVDAKDSADPSA